MAKFVALYRKPEDIEGFERHYREQHVPLVERWPKVQSWSVTRMTGTPRGGDPAYYLMFEATFATDEDLQACLGSSEMREAGMDAMQMSKQYATQVEMLLGTDFAQS